MADESVLYSDIKGQILQYLYRGLSETEDPYIEFIQEVSGKGNLNWHLNNNREQLATVFDRTATAIRQFEPRNGDLRSYLLEQLTAILFDVYKKELVTTFVRNGYNVPLESILSHIDKVYSIAPIQNTNFPRTENTSDRINPEPQPRLVPPSLYTDNL